MQVNKKLFEQTDCMMMLEPLTLVVALRPLSSEYVNDAYEFETDFLHLSTHPQRRLEQQISRQLRRQLLADYVGLAAEHLVFIKNEYGKPYLKQFNLLSLAPIEFSQSHCVDQFALVMNKQGIAVGIDIEAKTRTIPLQPLAQRILTPHELMRFEQAVDPSTFLLRQWTIKEAVLKASGLGIRLNLNELESIASLTQHSTSKSVLDPSEVTADVSDPFNPHVVCEAGQMHHAQIGDWCYQCFETTTHYCTIAWQAPKKHPVQVLWM